MCPLLLFLFVIGPWGDTCADCGPFFPLIKYPNRVFWLTPLFHVDHRGNLYTDAAIKTLEEFTQPKGVFP
jgi:hypothetical protein